MVDPVGTAVASPEPELPDEEPGSDETRPAEFSRTVELVAGVVVAIISIGVVAWMSRDQWFLSDSWDFITTREIGSLDDLLRPHAGHWQTPTVVAHRVLYGVFGLNYWPWYDLPRLAGHAFLAFVAWRAIRWRGGDQIFSFGVFVVLLFSGVSDWHRIATIGNFLVFPALIGIAVLLARYPKPGDRERFILVGLLVVALVSSGQGVAVLGGTTFAVLVSRRWREWGIPVLWAIAFYALWYFSFRDSGTASPDLSLDVLLDVPRLMLDVLVHACANSLSIPYRLAAVVVAATAAFIAWVAFKRREFGMYEGVLLSTLLAYLTLVVITRVAPGTAQAEAIRYSYAITFLVVPVVVPHLRFPNRATSAAAAVLVLLLIGYPNVDDLEERLDFWEGREQGSKLVIDTAGAMVAAGEPYVENSSVDGNRGGPLIVSGLVQLLEDGWKPVPSTDPDVQATARGALRMNVRPQGAIRGQTPVTAAPLIDGCATFTDTPIDLSLGAGARSFSLTTTAATNVELRWEDQHGLGVRQVRFRGPAPQYVTVARPDSPTTVTVVPPGQGGIAVEVCGLANG